MTREEAIKRFEKQLKGAIAVLDSGFGTLQGESNRLYLERKEMAEFALAALQEQEERRWIPFSDPPKEKGCYIVTVKHWYDGNPVVREAYWNGADWLSCERKLEITPRVTHWMHMPEPQKDV